MNDMMHGGASSDRGRRRAWPWRAGVLAITIGVVVLAAACSGRPSSTGSGGSPAAGGSQSSRLLAFAQCMRSHGVPNFPDPSSDLKFPTAQQLGVSSSRYQAAEGACQHLLPNGGSFTAAEAQQMLPAMRRFSQCMRSHGVPSWPDPTIGLDGKPGFDLTAIHPPIDTSSPQFASTQHECGHLVPRQLGGIPVSQP